VAFGSGVIGNTSFTMNDDIRRHVDYVYVNPLKHGMIRRVRDLPYSSFHRDVRAGLYPADCAGDPQILVPGPSHGESAHRFS